MVITMVFDGLATGGITKVGADYANMFVKKGYIVNIINLIPQNNDMVGIFDEKCNIMTAPYSRNMVYQRFSPLCVSGVGGILVYSGLSLLLSLVTVIFKSKYRIKFRSISNTDMLISFSGHYNDLGFVANNFVKSKGKVAWLHGTEFEYRIISEGFFDLFGRIKNIVCLSDYCDITCKKFNEIHKIKKRKIYNPVNLSDKTVSSEKVKSLKAEYGDFALMVGRLGKDKDQETAIRAIKEYNMNNNNKLNLLLVGDGPRRKDVESFVKHEGMSNTVFFMGTRSDVQNYYSAAKIFVHSSPLEGLPTVLLEAMYYGVPIAATDSFPGVREILGDNEYGLVSPIYDSTLLAENIQSIIMDNEMQHRLISAGNNRIKDFAPQRALKSVEDFFESILND